MYIPQLKKRGRTVLVDPVKDAGRMSMPDIGLAPDLRDGLRRATCSVRTSVSVQSALDTAAVLVADDERCVLREELNFAFLFKRGINHTNGEMEMVRFLTGTSHFFVRDLLHVDPELRVHGIESAVLLRKPASKMSVVIAVYNDSLRIGTGRPSQELSRALNFFGDALPLLYEPEEPLMRILYVVVPPGLEVQQVVNELVPWPQHIHQSPDPPLGLRC